jgi:hypothetical protein
MINVKLMFEKELLSLYLAEVVMMMMKQLLDVDV